MTSNAALFEYSRHVIDARECRDIATFIQRLGVLDDTIAVNLVGGDGSSAVFCEQHLTLVLADAPAVVIIDAIPAAAFISILTSKLALALGDAVALRLTLRTEFMADAAAAAGGVRHHIDQVLLLLDGFALQHPSTRLRSRMAALLAARQSWFHAMGAADNVLGMDTLQYEIVPALRSLTKALI